MAGALVIKRKLLCFFQWKLYIRYRCIRINLSIKPLLFSTPPLYLPSLLKKVQVQANFLLCFSSYLLSFCRRSHAVCGGGGTNPGNVAGAALQRRHGVFCGGLQRDDGAGRGTGVTVGGSQKRNLFRNTRKCLNSLTEETAGRIILAEGPLRSGFL